MKTLPFLLGLLVAHSVVIAQNYHAINGSSYGGSLGVGNNPAAIVNTPFAWDITVFGVQGKPNTNAVTVHNYSLLSSPANSEYQFNWGNYSRYAHANTNVNLLNTRVALSRRAAFAAGINFRSYTSAKTSPYNFADTISSATSFLMMNGGNTKYTADATSSNWVEIFGTYAQTIFDDDKSRLNVGGTLKVSRGLAGAHARLLSGEVERTVENGKDVYVLKDVSARYGYSSNFDGWKSEKSSSQNLNDFLRNSQGGASLDIGVEYLLRPYLVPDFNDQEDRYYDYDWKVGISILDIGFNQYKHSNNSRSVAGIKDDIRDAQLDEKFTNIDGVEGFNDSLATIVRSMSTLRGNFNVINPTRLVINVDRYLFHAFYVNADLSLNLSSLAGDQRLYVRETNLLTVTPRWETRRWGVYLPIMYNTENQLRVGGAFKAGPLLLGIHNWGTVFAKNKMQSGGGYIALVIRAFRNTGEKRYKGADCPPL
ncbi:DUF5723 family protein [Paraflavitalea pollutisoli]|uniref:DUF5723 family protein n=1 Tax=Paraflavitalea pollutisoli TaxID=3034143 RepID=UPI0023EDC90A|nr:DUF5723 family protein [Paraflavitalea sp. H1-2-19X]